MRPRKLPETPMTRRSLLIGLGSAVVAAGAAGTMSSGAGMWVTDLSAPSSSPAAQPGLINLPRIEWEGGPAYWSKFSKAARAGWADPSFFPLAVFYGRPAHVEQLKAVGINTFQGVEHNATLDEVTSKGTFCIAQAEFSASDIGDNPLVVGLFVNDECDIGLGCAGSNTNENLVDMQRQVSDLRSRNDGRFLNANYSKGVLDSFWAQNNMNAFMGLVDVASTDNYAYTSPDIDSVISTSPHWPHGVPTARSATYGWLVDRMRTYQRSPGDKPNWMLVETAMPFLGERGARTISPEEIEGACWSAIIHEARGIVFFQHNNDGLNGGYSLVECSDARKALIRASNSKITSLAPVINTQSYSWNFAKNLDTMLKAYQGSAYIFSEITLGTEPGPRTFTLPVGIRGTTVEVVGENRVLDVEAGKFSDIFNFEFTHHIYRLAI